MNNYADIPTEVLKRAAGMQRRGMGDFVDPFVEGTRPATSVPLPHGPADFPMALPPATIPSTMEGKVDRLISLQERLLDETVRQSIAARPVIRCKDVTAAGQTLDWTAVGIMDRLTLWNDGPDTVWIAFDMSGPAVFAGTSDLSVPVKANGAISLTHNLFSKIGAKTAGGTTATVNAIGWQSVAGNQAAAIS